MADRERSKGGCWTCKLRKKKCDEGQPSCASCLSLGIDCHGYGPRPAWMDGGSAEKAQLETWRLKVKLITNQKRRLRARQQISPSPEVHLSQKSYHRVSPSFPDTAGDVHLTPQSLPPADKLEDYAVALSKAWIPQWSPEQPEESPRIDSSSTLSLATPYASSELHQQHIYNSLPAVRENDVSLLMDYLDYVFPLQFPFYRKTAAEGGRGWLLSFIMQLEPLCHAALSVTAYFMHFEVLLQTYEQHFGLIRHIRELPACSRLESQLTEHILTINRISKLLSRLEHLERPGSEMHLSEYIELLSCIAMLISLEASYSFALLVFSALKKT